MLSAYLGIAFGALLSMIGVSFSTVKSVDKFDLDRLSYVPFLMSSVLALYCLIISVVAIKKIDDINPDAIMSASLTSGFMTLFSGLTLGFVVEKATEIKKGVIFVLIFIEAWALYGLIIGLLLLK